jgi:ATP-dependent protease HslVU (ClpYQ) peptidase subunit
VECHPVSTIFLLAWNGGVIVLGQSQINVGMLDAKRLQMNRLVGDKVVIVSFAGRAVMSCPEGADIDSVVQF